MSCPQPWIPCECQGMGDAGRRALFCVPSGHLRCNCVSWTPCESPAASLCPANQVQMNKDSHQGGGCLRGHCWRRECVCCLVGKDGVEPAGETREPLLGNRPGCLCKRGYILFEAAAGCQHPLLSPSSSCLRTEHRPAPQLSERSWEDGAGDLLGLEP